MIWRHISWSVRAFSLHIWFECVKILLNLATNELRFPILFYLVTDLTNEFRFVCVYYVSVRFSTCSHQEYKLCFSLTTYKLCVKRMREKELFVTYFLAWTFLHAFYDLLIKGFECVLWYCFISVCLDNHLYVYLFKILFIIIRISSVLLKLSFFLSFLLGAFTRFDYSMCVYVIFFFRENIVSRIYSNFKMLISRLSCIFTNLSYRNWIWRRARLGWCIQHSF